MSNLEMKAKYLQYLDSPGWKELRAQAYERANNNCELCGSVANAVHHIKYPKSYSEDKLSNLLVVCTLCHEKLHGIKASKKVPKVYLAGKIKKNCWRHDIFPELCGSKDNSIVLYDYTGAACYAGPYFISCDHGCYHGESQHGRAATNDSGCAGIENELTGRANVHKKCLYWLSGSNYVFAWIDSKTCYGTLVEIGFARAIHIGVYVFFKNEKLMDDMWFAYESRNAHYEPIAKTAKSAWEIFLKYIGG